MQDLTIEKGRIKINMKAIEVGEDLCVIISGGNSHHIGCVTLSVPRASLSDESVISATTSVLNLIGHKDDEAARYVSHTLSSKLNKNVAATCGIHVDNISPEEIEMTLNLLEELTDTLIQRYKGQRACTLCSGKGENMEEKKKTFETIDEYILQFPPEIQEILNTLRRVIKEAAPDAKEKISYQMPTFDLHGNLVHFAAFKNHIGFYPAPSGIDAFKQDLSEYKGAKGSVQFPIDKPLPYDLIGRIVKFRVAENNRKAEGKGKKKN